jgi:tetratricopeptide (TPR) repeat protein
VAGSELEFSSAMGLLKAYSLADNQGAGSYTMHPVLHQWSRSLSLDADAASLLSISVRVLGSAVPSDKDDDYWKLDRRLLQHVLHALNELRVLQTLAKQELSAQTTFFLGNLLSRHSYISEAEQMYCIALDGYERALGPDHASTLDLVNNIGILYSIKGKLDKAKQMYQRVLAGCEKALGSNHTSTLETVNNLGSLYHEERKLDKAGQIYQRALAGKEKALGPNHLSTLNTVNNLGCLYHEEGKLDEAEESLLRALTGYEKTLGKEALTTPLLSAVFNLGSLYYDQRRLDEAEKMYERARAGRQEIYGRSHHKTIEASERLERTRSKIGKSIHPKHYQRSGLTVSRSRPRCPDTTYINILTHSARQHPGRLVAGGWHRRLKAVATSMLGCQAGGLKTAIRIGA